ncbi:DNA polymerase III subunit gamma/tau [Sphingomonas astaxanthinifaciens]|uniref:DNA polymerase III subunit gamma/tau n=1 Tax=Sphingomonas astaxanthinifaciens DSM 22298 TaxID=1123267 RepID=A0ABQ5Z6P2_9SPHN|nr:DNA polymerase III subunit gamma/tau [Sphingomonas astaxanthinifaciens]GLR48430.1 DNA polymerase III subunit gamma/tau [Sphingomonas astaxanthinifaciens DSM 22298]
MTDDESPGLGLDLPAQPLEKSAAASPYRVLARKYRPQSFAELIGQDAMVRTLGNAIASGRIAHAFLLTGVRGVGKTSTARLVAKALNCIGPDGKGGPTIDPCGVCEPCRAIAEGRHIDVTEMDAASHTGVDDVREIIEAVRYSAVSARFKIYIIDEVHMLSKNAFNALLKTLEEPPAHVKFLFATTEVNKVPVTVLSRCQRFDLRRIPAEALVEHFRRIAEIEQVDIEPDALSLVARAAEGSARDGLSLLDQAIAHGAGVVTADAVRDMLGLADRGRIRRLLSLLLSGDAAGSLAELDEARTLGIEPTALLRGLMEQTHAATRTKAGGSADPLASAEERAASEELAGSLGWGQLHRLWQMLLKGLSDVAAAPDPNEAAAMVLLRIIHAAELPDPATVIARLQAGGETGAVSVPAARAAPPPAPRAAAAPAPVAPAPEPEPAEDPAPASFVALVDLIERRGKAIRASQLRREVGLIRYAPPELVLKPLQPLGPNFTRELTDDIRAALDARWTVTLGDGEAEPSLQAQEKMAEERAREAILAEPGVAAVFAAYPGTTLESVSSKDANHA